MGSIDIGLAADLRDRLDLKRCVETGTFRGITARALADVFEEVITIELSEKLHRAAINGPLRRLSNVRALQGHSARLLAELADPECAALYFLDGHWSGGDTSGADDECPVLEELAAIGAGNPSDVIVVDDARLYTSAPPPPHRAEQWPSLMEVSDAIRAEHRNHIVTVLGDQIIGFPPRAKPVIDEYGLGRQRVRFSAVRSAASAGLARIGRR